MEILRAIGIDQVNPQEMFEDVADAYGGAVYRLCRSLSYSQADADDLFQETFLRAFEQLPKLSASNNPQGFLFSTALYIWKSWKRKYARRQRLAPLEPLAETAVSGANTEDSLMAQEENRMVREAVAALPDKFKIPVILYYAIEMSLPEIALTMKIPVGTVKSRLFKARKLVEKGLVALNDEG